VEYAANADRHIIQAVKGQPRVGFDILMRIQAGGYQKS